MSVTGLTPAQEEFLRAMTDQRVTNFFEAVDAWSNLPEATKRFLREAEPETLDFLRRARPFEIVELEQGIELVRSVKTTSRVVKFGIITLFGTFMGVLAIWEGWSRLTRGGK